MVNLNIYMLTWLHTLFIYLGWHTLYQPVDKQGKERGKGLPRFLAVFDTVSVAAVVRRTTAYIQWMEMDNSRIVNLPTYLTNFDADCI